ncbi:MAG: cysteine--tRNA ligase, partial [Mesorhizobium sp.]
LETETFGGRTWPGEVLRLAMLMTHYREPIDFSVRKLEEAENTLRKWKRAADLAPAAAKDLPAEVVEALSDDLATYTAFQRLTQLAGEAVEA